MLAQVPVPAARAERPPPALPCPPSRSPPAASKAREDAQMSPPGCIKVSGGGAGRRAAAT